MEWYDHGLTGLSSSWILAVHRDMLFRKQYDVKGGVYLLRHADKGVDILSS
jgi:hypothetical protein